MDVEVDILRVSSIMCNVMLPTFDKYKCNVELTVFKHHPTSNDEHLLEN
jgi:hypothetical protein